MHHVNILEREEDIAGRAKKFLIPRGPIGILLIHGFAGSIADLRPTGERLAEQGFSVAGVRLAGHGSRPEFLRQTMAADWLASVDAGLKDLLTVARQVIVIGDSFGGNLGLDLAVRRSDVVRGVVMLSSPAYGMMERLKALILPALEVVHPYHRKAWVTESMKRDHIEKGSYLTVPMRSYGHMLKFLAEQERTTLPQVQCPVLMIYLSDDQVISPSGAHQIYHALGTQEKQLYWVRGVYHHPLASDKQGAIVEKIVEFIQKATKAI
jgi:carboxylesterase